MREKDDTSTRTRRDVLKHFGTAGIALAASTVPVSANPDVARKFRADTSDYENLTDVAVTLLEDGTSKVRMEGRKPSDAETGQGYRVTVQDLVGSNGSFTPSKASTALSTVSASPDGIDTKSEPSESSTLGSDGTVGTMGSSGGTDSGTNYEGTAWARGEDPADIRVTKSLHYGNWSTSGGEVSNLDRAYKAQAYRVDLGYEISRWHVEDSGWSGQNYSGDDAYSKMYADYYNYTWNNDSKRTEIHHRIEIWGNPDGTMDWAAEHWRNGENHELLRHDAGYYADDIRYDIKP